MIVFAAIRHAKGRSRGCSKDILAPALFYVSLAYGCYRFAEVDEQFWFQNCYLLRLFMTESVFSF